MSIVAFVDDLFFIGKLQGAARQAGVPLTVVRAADFNLESLRADNPALVILDLNTTSADAVDLIRKLKKDEDLKPVPVLGFFSHVQVELQRAATEAGCEQVMPRSKFSATLPDLLLRYAHESTR